jgi:hypothetical protein
MVDLGLRGPSLRELANDGNANNHAAITTAHPKPGPAAGNPKIPPELPDGLSLRPAGGLTKHAAIEGLAGVLIAAGGYGNSVGIWGPWPPQASVRAGLM